MALRLRRANTVYRTLLGGRPSSNLVHESRTRHARYPQPTRRAAHRRRWTAFTRRGYDATSVAELAAATGMSKAAVSYHFRTKNDLLHAVADPLLDSLDALVDRHPTDTALARAGAGPARATTSAP